MMIMAKKFLNWIDFLMNNQCKIQGENSDGYNGYFKPSQEDYQNEEQIEDSVEVPVIEENTPEPVCDFYYNDKVILLDNGHAKSTPGKRSPKFDDGSQFFEYEFNRDVVKRISCKLNNLGITNHILVPEIEEDIPLSTRAARANKYCCQYGAGNCLFISVHVNAAGNGCDWACGRGWSVYTTKGETNSDKYATVFFEEAQKILPNYNMTLRKDMSDGDPD